MTKRGLLAIVVLTVAAATVLTVGGVTYAKNLQQTNHTAVLTEEMASITWTQGTAYAPNDPDYPRIKTIITVPEAGSYEMNCQSYQRLSNGRYALIHSTDDAPMFVWTPNQTEKSRGIELMAGPNTLAIQAVYSANTLRCSVSSFTSKSGTTIPVSKSFTFTRP
jgi:hypothetical protein